MSKPSSILPPSSSSPAKRACDSCHRRKVKCVPVGNEPSPCRTCVTQGLECTFFNKVQKKGPKGSRSKVLSELRETQKFISPRPPLATSSSSSISGGGGGGGGSGSGIGGGGYGGGGGGGGGSSGAGGGAGVSAAGIGHDGASGSQSPALRPYQRTPGLMSHGLVNACIEFYFASIYPEEPLIELKCIEQTIATMDQNVEGYCFLTAVCSYVLMHSRSILPPSLQSLVDVDQPNSPIYYKVLFDEATRVRRNNEWSETPSLIALYTSYYLFRCQHLMDNQDAAWIFLRQATTLAHVLNMHKEDTYQNEERQIYSILRRRMYWALYIAERDYAIKLHRPLTLSPSIQTPETLEEDVTPSMVNGFKEMIKLYLTLEDRFYACWNGDERESPHTDGWLGNLLDETTNILPSPIEYLPTSVVALSVTRQWFRTTIWRLQTRHSNSVGMRVKILISICQELVEQLNSYNRISLEILGLGLAEKIFDIVLSLISCSEYVPYDIVQQYRDCLYQLFHSLRSLPSAQARLVPNLQAKLPHLFDQNVYMPSQQTHSHQQSHSHSHSHQHPHHSTSPILPSNYSAYPSHAHHGQSHGHDHSHGHGHQAHHNPYGDIQQDMGYAQMSAPDLSRRMYPDQIDNEKAGNAPNYYF